ncbi:hypothetical protein TNCV_3588871 [Trichonephila clavipes]|nr:hypothetical protein TNCV_3588871 [Trichonephila clavipes]
MYNQSKITAQATRYLVAGSFGTHAYYEISRIWKTTDSKNAETLAYGSWRTWKVGSYLMAARRVIAGYLVLKPAGGGRELSCKMIINSGQHATSAVLDIFSQFMQWGTVREVLTVISLGGIHDANDAF